MSSLTTYSQKPELHKSPMHSKALNETAEELDPDQKMINVNACKYSFIDIPIHRSSPFLQAKLIVNKRGDEYEQEADAVAEKVMRMTEPAANGNIVPSSSVNIVRRKCPSCGNDEEVKEETEKKQEKNHLTSLNLIQRKCAACEEEDKENKINRKESGYNSPIATSSVNKVLNSTGRPIDRGIRSFMEGRFRFDFSKVRIHDDAQAHRSAEDINALAYTYLNNIVFAAGQYRPQTDSGKKLLAHELTHVVQQNENTIRRQEVCEPIVYDEGEQVCRPSDPDDYTPQVSEDMENDGEFWTYPPRMRQPVRPIIDEETNKIVGFKYGGSYWEIYDLEGNMVESGEIPLESPLIDPIDLIAGGLTGLGRSLFRSGVRSAGRGAVTSAARSAGTSLLRSGIGIALRTLSQRAATLIRATYRAIRFRGVLNFTFTTATRMADPARRVPIHILKLALRFGQRVPDPQGVAGAFKYTIPMIRNGTQYTLEVVIREADNTILHFLYR